VNVFHSLRFGSPRVDEAWVDEAWADETGSPRFSFPAPSLPAVRVTELFASRPGEVVVALGLPPVDALRGSAERDSTERESAETGPVARAPAATGEKWLRCMDCCRRAVCCWKDSVCDAVCVPKKCCAALL
jgi:hypothetical protein